MARLVPGTPAGVAVIDVRCNGPPRVILRHPGVAGPATIGPLVAAAARHGRVVVEDSFGSLVLPLPGTSRWTGCR